MPRKSSSAARVDVYSRITAEIIAALEGGPGEWRAPWFHDGTDIARPTNVASGKKYRGVNVLALWVAGMAAGYGDGLWGTYRQWQAAGAQVRKGERSTSVVLWKTIKDTRHADDEDEESGSGRLFARAFNVFNAAQVDGYERPTADDVAAGGPAGDAHELPESARLAHAEEFIANLGIKTVFGGSRAYYLPSSDTVFMPHFSAFQDAVSFYSTWLHEHGHGSGASHRLDRDLSGSFGSASYAAEELVVEIMSGFVLADLGIAHHPRPDHAAYVESWLKCLKHDDRAIFKAASKAQQAADWMHAQQPGGEVPVPVRVGKPADIGALDAVEEAA